MLQNDINILLEVAAESIVESIKIELQAIGLGDSDLIKSVTYTIQNFSIAINMPNYYEYVESGRLPRVKRVPINILISWMNKKGISLGKKNSIAYAIQTSIYKQGIRPRPFLKAAYNRVENEYAEILAIDLSELLVTDLYQKII